MCYFMISSKQTDKEHSNAILDVSIDALILSLDAKMTVGKLFILNKTTSIYSSVEEEELNSK